MTLGSATPLHGEAAWGGAARRGPQRAGARAASAVALLFLCPAGTARPRAGAAGPCSARAQSKRSAARRRRLKATWAGRCEELAEQPRPPAPSHPHPPPTHPPRHALCRDISGSAPPSASDQDRLLWAVNAFGQVGAVRLAPLAPYARPRARPSAWLLRRCPPTRVLKAPSAQHSAQHSPRRWHPVEVSEPLPPAPGPGRRCSARCSSRPCPCCA